MNCIKLTIGGLYRPGKKRACRRKGLRRGAKEFRASRGKSELILPLYRFFQGSDYRTHNLYIRMGVTPQYQMFGMNAA